MDRRGFLSAVTGVGIASLAGCSTSLLGSESEDGDPYKSVVRANARANEEEDLELLKETLHPESPIYDDTIEQSQQIWAEYELAIELAELEVIERPSTTSGSGSGANAMQIQRGDGDGCQNAKLQAFQISQGSDCEQEARVQYVQVTRNENDAEFTANRVEGIHILRPTESDWKLWESEVQSTERV